MKEMLIVQEGFSRSCKIFIPEVGYALAISFDTEEFNDKILKVISEYNITDVSFVGMPMAEATIGDLIERTYPQIACHYNNFTEEK